MSPAEYTAESRRHTMLLAEALDFLESQGLSDAERSALEGGELFDEVEGLDVDCAVLRLPPRAGRGAVLLTYMWDWLVAHPVEERAARIREQLLEDAKALAGGVGR